MINSIPTIESTSANTFGKVTNKKAPKEYWLAAQPTLGTAQSNNIQPAQVQTSSSPNTNEQYLAASPTLEKFKIITPEEARKTNNIKLIGLSVAGATVLTAGTIFLLLKGGPKGIGKNFNKLRTFLEKKVQKAKLDGDGVLSTTNKIYVYALDKMNKLQERSGFINNYTTLKDLLFKRMMSWNKYLAKGHDAITRRFERIGRQSVVNSYNMSEGLLRRALNIASRSTHASGSKPVTPELLKCAESLNQEIGISSDKYFGSVAQRIRYFSIKSAVENMKQSFSKLKVFLSKDIYRKFMADSQLVSKRESIITGLQAHRKELSYPVATMVKEADESVMKIVSGLSFKETEKITHLRSIRTLIRKYAKCKTPEARQEVSAKLIQEIEKFSGSVSEGLQNKSSGAESANKLLAEIANLKSRFVNYKPGKVEEVLDIYRQVLPKSEYKKVEGAYSAWLRSLDKAIKTETEDFMGKLRDLAMGSAPTDILTMVGSLGILGYNLAKSKDNDQRTSIALKYGIPALAGIGGSLYFNAKLFAGSKALICGSILSLAVNRLGTWADNTLKARKLAKKENTSKTV